MAAPEPAKETPAAEVQARLRLLAQVLHQTDHLEREAQQELADLLDELGSALHAEALSREQMAHLTDSTHHLVDAVRKQQGGGVLTTAREGLEKAVIAVESDAPVAAGIVRRLMDALANLGI